MNAYILVEGRKCERLLYPAWIAYFAPHMNRVDYPADVTSDSYYLLSAEGYPSILRNHLTNAISDVEDIGKFDWLVIALDSDERSVEETRQKVLEALENSPTVLRSAQLYVIIQFRCIETWLLGNRKIFGNNPRDKYLIDYIQHYDVRERDPEAMPVHPEYRLHARFHTAYLKAAFRDLRKRYEKSRPSYATEPHYIEELDARIRDLPNHLRSFSRFVRFCRDELSMQTRKQ